MVNPNLRNYRIPTYADVPRTEVLLVDSTDSVGPMRSKGMAECCINPVAPALANALENATGVRFRALPLTPERIYSRLGPSRLARGDVSREERAMDTKNPTDAAATVIIGQRVRAGSELAFEAWQEEMNREASQVPGIPRRRDQPSDRRAARMGRGLPLRLRRPRAGLDQQRAPGRIWLARGQQYFDGPGTQQVIGGGARPTDPLVTVVVTHRVSPENVDDFLAWQDRLRLAESKFAGFRGTELFRPVEGVQEEWTALYRYDNATDLDTWLMSKERQDLLAEGEKFSDFQLAHDRQLLRQLVRLRREGQRGAAAVGDEDLHRGVGGPLPDRRAAHPRAVAAEDAAVAGPADRKPDLQLHHELRDDALLREPAAETLAATAAGRACKAQDEPAGHRIVAGVTAFWVVVFYLVTTQFWTLP